MVWFSRKLGMVLFCVWIVWWFCFWKRARREYRGRDWREIDWEGVSKERVRNTSIYEEKASLETFLPSLFFVYNNQQPLTHLNFLSHEITQTPCVTFFHIAYINIIFLSKFFNYF